jgi:AraC-like DNA-binding protein
MIVEVAVAKGVTERDCLRGTGLSPADLTDLGRTVEARQELAVARNLVGLVGPVPGLGMRAGLHYTIGSVGILGFAVLSSPTMRDAMTIALRYVALTSAFLHITVEETGGRVFVVFDDRDIPADVRVFLVERDLAAIGRIIPVLVGTEFPFAQVTVELRLGADHCEALSGMFPGIDLVPGRPRNALSLPRELYDRALPQADPHTASLCEQQCHELLDRRQRRRGTAATVRSLLLRDPSNMPSMDTAAGQLSLEPRTLHRHLARENTSYRALTNETREALATELLTDTGLTVAEVAHRLGYSEVAAFSRAFKTWTGAPPSAYRRR